MGGCAHGPDSGREFTRVYTPQVPVFLSGPTAALLTNSPGFSAHVIVRGDSAFPGSEPVEGEVLGRGSKLLFAPRETGAEKKQLRLGGFSFIWDVSTGSGFVLSDALQAYAPVASSLRITNVVVPPGDSTSPTVFLNDGTKASFRVSSGAGRNELPSRIEQRGTLPLDLSFSKVLRQAPSPELFAPPDGFAKYPSAEALADEIAVRRHNLSRSPREPAILNLPERK